MRTLKYLPDSSIPSNVARKIDKKANGYNDIKYKLIKMWLQRKKILIEKIEYIEINF